MNITFRALIIAAVLGCVAFAISRTVRSVEGAESSAAETAGYLLPDENDATDPSRSPNSLSSDAPPIHPTDSATLRTATSAPSAATEKSHADHSSDDTTAAVAHMSAPSEATSTPASTRPGADVLAAVAGLKATPELVRLASQLAHEPRAVLNARDPEEAGCTVEQWNLAQAYAAAATGDDAAAERASAQLAAEHPDVSSAHRPLDEYRRRGELGQLTASDAIAHAGWMAIRARAAELASSAGDSPAAARAYSDLLKAELDAPWPADRTTLRAWSAALRTAQSRHRWNRNGDWPSLNVTVVKGDSLIAVRKRVIADHPELLICTGMIERANELHGAVLQAGQVLRIPTDPVRMRVDLAAHWALFSCGDEIAAAWEVGIGGEGSETRVGEYVVGEKNTEPMWFPAGKPPVPYGDPTNPLGSRWIAWLDSKGVRTRLGFHGTNDPTSVGQDRSQGCIRMRNQDVEELFELVPKGARIDVRP